MKNYILNTLLSISTAMGVWLDIVNGLLALIIALAVCFWHLVRYAKWREEHDESGWQYIKKRLFSPDK